MEKGNKKRCKEIMIEIESGVNESEDFKSTSLVRNFNHPLPVVQVILHIAHQLPEEELTGFQNERESIVSQGRAQVATGGARKIDLANIKEPERRTTSGTYCLNKGNL